MYVWIPLPKGLRILGKYVTAGNDAVTDWVWKSLIGILYIRVHDVEEQSNFKISSKYLPGVETNVSKNKRGKTYHLQF